MSLCWHLTLSLAAAEATQIRYRRPGKDQVPKALSVSDPARKRSKYSSHIAYGHSGTADASVEATLPPASTFPAPVVAPGDELFRDPDYPPQSVQQWIEEGDRNEVTTQRKTIYVLPPPSVSDDIPNVKEWSVPETMSKEPAERTRRSQNPSLAQPPSIEDIVEYLGAFYYGTRIKLLKKPRLQFMAWHSSGVANVPRKRALASKNTAYIGLSTGSEMSRIRSRRPKDEMFPYQLSLNDLLDTAINILPKDAYALLMLVHHDIYEDDDDDFCCGRAYVSFLSA